MRVTKSDYIFQVTSTLLTHYF